MEVRAKRKRYMNFLEKYIKKIKPKLSEIDIFIKSIEDTAAIFETAYVLDLYEKEVKFIMKRLKLSEINKENFLLIMENGSSEICRLYKRELVCGSPLVYSKEEIAYIYELDIKKVVKAYQNLNIKEATAYTLPDLFAEIS